MKLHKDVQFNTDPHAVGASIRELRRRAHLSQGELAHRLGMRQGPVSNLEQGKNLPSAQVLVRLASILNATTDQILRAGAYTTPAQSDVANEGETILTCRPSLPVILNTRNPALYLTSAAVSLIPGNKLTDTVESVVRDYLALEDICKVPRQARIPLQFAFDPTPSGIGRLTTQVRTLLGVSDAVVFDHLELFENHGLRVVFMPLPKEVTNISCYDAQNGNVFILISSRLTPEKQLFSLVYGLGRILLYNRSIFLGEFPLKHETRKDKAARLFAADFLMPEPAVRNSVSQIGVCPDEWDIDLLLRLKHRFGVSAETFNYRLLELGLMTSECQVRLRTAIKAYYASHAFAEPGQSRRILSPNGRLGDLLYTALRRADPEAPAIAGRFKKQKLPMP